MIKMLTCLFDYAMQAVAAFAALRVLFYEYLKAAVSYQVMTSPCHLHPNAAP
jgi:hypothetical protein